MPSCTTQVVGVAAANASFFARTRASIGQFSTNTYAMIGGTTNGGQEIKDDVVAFEFVGGANPQLLVRAVAVNVLRVYSAVALAYGIELFVFGGSTRPRGVIPSDVSGGAMWVVNIDGGDRFCSAGFGFSDGGECLACPAGMYAGLEDPVCRNCSAGTYGYLAGVRERCTGILCASSVSSGVCRRHRSFSARRALLIKSPMSQVGSGLRCVRGSGGERERVWRANTGAGNSANARRCHDVRRLPPIGDVPRRDVVDDLGAEPSSQPIVAAH